MDREEIKITLGEFISDWIDDKTFDFESGRGTCVSYVTCPDDYEIDELVDTIMVNCFDPILEKINITGEEIISLPSETSVKIVDLKKKKVYHAKIMIEGESEITDHTGDERSLSWPK